MFSIAHYSISIRFTYYERSPSIGRLTNALVSVKNWRSKVFNSRGGWVGLSHDKANKRTSISYITWQRACLIGSNHPTWALPQRDHAGHHQTRTPWGVSLPEHLERYRQAPPPCYDARGVPWKPIPRPLVDTWRSWPSPHDDHVGGNKVIYIVSQHDTTYDIRSTSLLVDRGVALTCLTSWIHSPRAPPLSSVDDIHSTSIVSSKRALDVSSVRTGDRGFCHEECTPDGSWHGCGKVMMTCIQYCSVLGGILPSYPRNTVLYYMTDIYT